MPRDPWTAAAAIRFYEDLKAGKAVKKDDPYAPPLAIEKPRKDGEI